MQGNIGDKTGLYIFPGLAVWQKRNARGK